MSAQPSIEQRLERVEVRAELEDLVTRYSMAVDDRDLDAVLELFTPDASFGHKSDPGIVGHEAIRKHYQNRLGGLVYSYHYAHNQLIEWNGGDDATGEVNAHAEMAFPDNLVIAALRYHDTYRRVDGVWRFARRDQSFYYFLPAKDLVAGDYATGRKRWPGPALEAELPDSLATYSKFLAEMDSSGSSNA
ncbi:MAG: nuclear transport factor 2 family protein [Microthrixaceae bacterium]